MRGRDSNAILRWSSDFLPELQAENLPFDRAETEMLRYHTRRNPEGLLLSAWNHVEFAMNKYALTSEVRDSYFDLSQNLLLRSFSDTHAHRDTQLNSLVLSTYIPLFRKRAFSESIGKEDCNEVYRSLGSAISYIQPLKVDEPPQWEMLETAVLGLSARTQQPNLLLYPASPREENSPHSWLNHDSYFYSNNIKVPVQQKLVHTDKEYADWMTVLTVLPIVDKAFKRSGINGDIASMKINYLLALMVAETSGERIDREENRFLNILTSAVASHRWTKDIKKSNTAA